MKIHKITRWSVDAVMASAFRVGRVFLVGDAAHRHPPTGGLGLTSAIHDVHNLCWKLAAVLDGTASPELLDTYEPERRSADERNAQRSLENAVNHFAIVAALGISPENAPEENWANLRRMWSGRPEDAEHRANALRAMRMQSMEFSELNVEYGYTYDSAAVVPDGSPRRDRSTTSASTSRRRGPARRCRTPGSTTRTAAAGRSRTWSRRDASCSSPARTAARGARPPGSSPTTPASRSTRSASATSTATSTTRAASGCATARSGRRRGARPARPLRRMAQPGPRIGRPLAARWRRARAGPRPAASLPRSLPDRSHNDRLTARSRQ